HLLAQHLLIWTLAGSDPPLSRRQARALVRPRPERRSRARVARATQAAWERSHQTIDRSTALPRKPERTRRWARRPAPWGASASRPSLRARGAAATRASLVGTGTKNSLGLRE